MATELLIDDSAPAPRSLSRRCFWHTPGLPRTYEGVVIATMARVEPECAYVGVAGAGIVGLAAAMALQELGIDVRCLEPGRPGAGREALWPQSGWPGPTPVAVLLQSRVGSRSLLRRLRLWPGDSGRPLVPATSAPRPSQARNAPPTLLRWCYPPDLDSVRHRSFDPDAPPSLLGSGAKATPKLLRDSGALQ